jgi:phage portal protein BeeE
MGAIRNYLDARAASKIASRLAESKKIAQEIRQRLILSPICSDYENLFAQVRPLINDMKVVRPFGVNANGDKLPMSKTLELAILNDPNEEMSWAEFADLCFATYLTKDQLYIHVHKSGRNGHVSGYTIIPAGAATWNGKEIVFDITNPDGTTERLTKADVMTLRFSRSPEDPFKGVSPASAARAWAQTDDLIAQYQRAYFENGAIPSTITFITASTKEKYDQVRQELESKLKGAKNHNKTVYAWRQFLQDTGDSKDQIEVKPIQGANNTLAIESIVEIINDRLNKAVGVSNFIMGDDSSAKYSNAELSDQQFIKRRVYPALLGFWSQFQHELDRITGGLGYGIQFELEIPELTDRAKTKAETAEKNTNTLITLIEAGADPTSSVQALELPQAWNKVAAGIWTKVLAEKNEVSSIVEHKHDAEAPSQAQLILHSHDDCQHDHDYIIDELKPLTPEEQKIYDALIDLARAIIEENPGTTEDEVAERITEILQNEANLGGNASAKKIAKMVKEADLKELIAQVAKEGYQITSSLQDRIKIRTAQIVAGYADEVREQMRAILNNTRGLTAEEMRKRLEQIIPKYRARMIARNETVYAFKSGRLEADENFAQEYDLKVKLVWKCSLDSKTCDACAAMDGKTVTLGQAWQNEIDVKAGEELKNGHVIEEDGIVAWEKSEWNDQGLIPNAHVNCRCYFNEELA